MMTELSIRLKQVQGLEKRIQRGRVVAAILNLCLFTAVVIVNSMVLAGILDNKRSFRALAQLFSALYGVLFISLSISVFILIKAMMDRNRDLAYKNEICVILFTLIIFCLSYALGFFYDLSISVCKNCHEGEVNFKDTLLRLLLLIPFSMIPLFAIICLHRSNLKSLKKQSGVGQVKFDLNELHQER